jgi:hypothetical protein
VIHGFVLGPQLRAEEQRADEHDGCDRFVHCNNRPLVNACVV